MRLIFCDTLDGNNSSLKNKDPLDFAGDGSNIPLEVGDRAVVADASGKAAFYVFKEAPGQSDDGILLVIPNVNPGDFYWWCCGFTKDQIDVPVGTQFDIKNGSEIPPDGFSVTTIPYSEFPFSSWDVFYNGVEKSYYGSALINNVLYVIDGVNLHIWDLTSNAYSTESIDNSHGFDEAPTHCLEYPEGGSDDMITDVHFPSTLSRFLIKERKTSHMPFVFLSPSSSWEDIFGTETIPSMAMRIGKWMFVCSIDPDIGFGKIDILTGEVHKLADFPSAPKDGCMCPDFVQNQIYYVCEDPDYTTMRYSIDEDSWEILTDSPADIGWLHMGWVDQKSRQLILPGLDNNTYIYDILLDTWSTYSHTESVTEGGIPLYYKNLGMVCPFGYENADSSLTHFIIRKDNPTRITKT